MTGMIHLYCGDGKGKTTAAVGLAVRAAGAGRKVLFAQFLKNGDSAELDPLRSLGVRTLISPVSHGFLWTMSEEERKQAEYNIKIMKAYQKIVLNLYEYTGKLPELIAQDLESKIVDYYNVINKGDADFEMLSDIFLPSDNCNRLTITFRDGNISDADWGPADGSGSWCQRIATVVGALCFCTWCPVVCRNANATAL